MSLVFFVSKKNGGKRVVIDYCNLNNQTVKNNYLLPLIMDLIDNMGSKQVFTQMDLCYESPKKEISSHTVEHLIIQRG